MAVSNFQQTANIVGLKGFSRWGKIDQYFTDGYFPAEPNWKPTHFRDTAIAIQRVFGGDKYILICFSDGGTIAHEIAHADVNCIGLIAHSATFIEPFRLRNIPTLILSTKWDFTGMRRQSDRAFDFYRRENPEQWTEKIVLDRTTWHGHEFANGLQAIQLWVQYAFGLRLPIKQ